MDSYFQRVSDWNQRAEVKRVAELEGADQHRALSLAVDLIDEEVGETKHALSDWAKGGNEALIEIADGIGDSIVVLCGLAYRLGIPLDAVMDEILSSNDSKLEGGIQRRGDGKILKGPNYRPPNIEAALLRVDSFDIAEVEAGGSVRA